MKALKVVGIVLVAIVVILGVAVLFQPSQGHIEQSIVVNAPPASVYKAVNGFKTFRSWSPWAKMDPEAKYSFEGPEEGVGAKMIWDGEKTGKGSQMIEESVENQKVRCSLTFDGYDGKAYADFNITSEGDGTKLTWTYDGVNDGFTGKAMWLVMGSMLEGQYKEGLVDLKAYVESQPLPDPQ